MNRAQQSEYDSFIHQENLNSCSIHKNNSIQGVFVGEKCQAHLSRLQCFKCVLKSKDLKCISIQNIFSYQHDQIQDSLSLNSIPSNKQSQEINEQEIDEELINDFEEYEQFWPPLSSDLKDKIKMIQKKLNTNIMDKIIKTFDNIKSEFVNTIEQIKKETLLIAQQVIEDFQNLNTYYEEQKQLDIFREIIEKNNQDSKQTNLELDEFIRKQYEDSESINRELSKKIFQITYNLPQISEEVFNTFSSSLEKLLTSFRSSQQKKSLTNIKFEKSLYEKSNLIKFEDNLYGFQSMIANFEGRGQIYSSCTFEPDEKYQVIFEFDRPPKECIILGLTEDENKDLNWYDRSYFYAIQLGKSTNDSFCEKILKGKNIKQMFTNNSKLAMQFHIAKNQLYFADYPSFENINALDPKQYVFDPSIKYRIIIYFRNQDGLKLSLLSAHQIHELQPV